MSVWSFHPIGADGLAQRSRAGWQGSSCCRFCCPDRNHGRMKTVMNRSADEGPVYDGRYMVGHAKVVKAVDKRFDVVGSRLASLINVCCRQSGRLLAGNRQRHPVGVQESALDYIVECVTAALSAARPEGAPARPVTSQDLSGLSADRGRPWPSWPPGRT